LIVFTAGEARCRRARLCREIAGQGFSRDERRLVDQAADRFIREEIVPLQPEEILERWTDSKTVLDWFMRNVAKHAEEEIAFPIGDEDPACGCCCRSSPIF
jgi:hypothetical protein